MVFAVPHDTVLVSDGGLATELEARGHDLSDDLWSARLLVDSPDEIVAVHEAFYRAGADIATSASYQASFDGFAARGIARSEAERLGYTHRNIVSGAGHDACWINRVAPTAMVFCPCVDGLSHNEAEDISKEWAAAGADVLFHAVVETAGIVG